MSKPPERPQYRQEGVKLVPEVQAFSRKVAFWLVDYGQRGECFAFGESVVMHRSDGDEYAVHAPPPTFSLPVDTVQELFEQLWAQGFRSVHDTGGAEKLDAARREHIVDLRRAAKLEPVVEHGQ